MLIALYILITSWLEMTSAERCASNPMLPRRWETVADYELRTGVSLPMFDKRDIVSLMFFACFLNKRLLLRDGKADEKL